MNMLIPRYYYAGHDPELYQYLLAQPHTERCFQKDEYLWSAGEYIKEVYYIRSGVVVAAINHEDGYEKIFLFSGKGSIYPGCHETQFKIEQSITAKAISMVDTLVFPREQFYEMFQDNKRLNALMFETYAMYINLLLYESAHQEFNNVLVKLCNLLFLFFINVPAETVGRVNLSQEMIGSILAINRVSVAKALSQLRNQGIIRTHRNWIEILEVERLKKFCSLETLPITLP